MALVATLEQPDMRLSVKEKHLNLTEAILHDKTKTDDPVLASLQAWTLMFDEALNTIR